MTEDWQESIEAEVQWIVGQVAHVHELTPAQLEALAFRAGNLSLLRPPERNAFDEAFRWPPPSAKKSQVDNIAAIESVVEKARGLLNEVGGEEITVSGTDWTLSVRLASSADPDKMSDALDCIAADRTVRDRLRSMLRVGNVVGALIYLLTLASLVVAIREWPLLAAILEASGLNAAAIRSLALGWRSGRKPRHRGNGGPALG